VQAVVVLLESFGGIEWLKVAKGPLALAPGAWGWHEKVLLLRGWTALGRVDRSTRRRGRARSAAGPTDGAGDEKQVHMTSAEQHQLAAGAACAGQGCLLMGARLL
jgi:hypothetical protein